VPADPTEVDLAAVVGSLDARIRAERAEAAAAARSLGEARARLEAADAALAAAQRGVDTLVSGARVLATPGFLEPRSENGARVLPLTIDAATGERLMAARDRVAAEAERRSAVAVAVRAQARRAEAATSEAEAAAARRAELLEEAQRRLAEELDEATVAGDVERQAEVKAHRDELVVILEAPERAAARKAKADAARKARDEAKARADAEAAARARAEAALTPGPIGPPTGGYPAVPCPGGGSVTVDGSLAHNVHAMLLTAWRDGVNLCGGGSGTGTSRSGCASSTVDPRSTRSTRCRPAAARHRPRSLARPCTNGAWPSTSSAQARACPAARAPASNGWPRTPPRSASSICRASRGTGAQTGPDRCREAAPTLGRRIHWGCHDHEGVTQ
jgi:hypothetical protein